MQKNKAQRLPSDISLLEKIRCLAEKKRKEINLAQKEFAEHLFTYQTIFFMTLKLPGKKFKLLPVTSPLPSTDS
jgi:hypothetical protein